MPARAQSASLADLSFEELGDIQITSVSKHAERVLDAPASVFVITADDIRRAGVSTLPEALRLAPNLQVAQRSASQYSISSRGFNNTAGNKLLVLIDGRSVYTPLFSGVFWDAQDVLMEDIERIEVISGPAGTLWGANAVNGVINIITQSARDTRGTLASVGSAHRGADVAMRHGGSHRSPGGNDANFRVYAKYADQAHTSTGSGRPIEDDWHKRQAGFRVDGGLLGDQWTVQGDVYEGREGQPAPGTITITGVTRPLNLVSISGANLLSRWRHRLGGGSGVDLLAYYDRTTRDVPGTFNDTMDVVDLQFQHSSAPNEAGSFVWGAEYRHGVNRMAHSDFIAFLPADIQQVSASLFGQLQYSIRPGWQVTLGAREESNRYTGPEFLPSIRLAWKPAPDHLLWAAASRTVRAPSRIDRDFYYPAPGAPLTSVRVDGGPRFRSEIAKVYELGYRGQPTDALSYSVTAFYTDYDHLRTFEVVSLTQTQTQAQAIVQLTNEMHGTASGVEMWGTYQASSQWRLSAGLSSLKKRLAITPGVFAANQGVAGEGNDPSYSWNMRSSLNLSSTSELDVIVRRVGSLPVPAVPSYVAVDVRLGWRPRPNLELSIGGQNLFNRRHAEFYETDTRGEFGPRAFFKVTSRF